VYGCRVRDDNGRYGVQIVREAGSKDFERRSLGFDGLPVLEGLVASESFKHVATNILMSEYYGVSNQRTVDTNGVFSCFCQVSHNGYSMKNWALNRQGRPISLSKTHSAYVSVFERNIQGQLLSVSYFDAEESPVLDSSIHVHSINYHYGPSGRFIGLEYKGLNEELVEPFGLGYAVMEEKYDKQARKLRQAYFDSELKPVRHKSYGMYVLEIVFNPKGQPILELPLDQSNKPMAPGVSSQSYFRISYPASNQTLVMCFDTNGCPAGNWKNGKSVGYRIDREQNGRFIRQLSLDQRTNIVMSESWECAVIESVSDVSNRVFETRFLNEYGMLTNVEGGYAVVNRIIDRHGRLQELSFFDSKRRAVKGLNGYWKRVIRYDAYGNVCEEAYVAPNGKPFPFWRKCSKKVFVRNRFGDTLEERYYDKNRRLAADWVGVAIVRRRYFQNGLLFEEIGYDAAGRPFTGSRFRYENDGKAVIRIPFRVGPDSTEIYDQDARGGYR
jgi:hypothetical protein